MDDGGFGPGSEGGEDLRETVAKRGDVLAALRSTPRGKPALVEALSVSRSTVDRAIDELTGVGLVERDGDVYRPTPAGRLALKAYRPYVQRTAGLAAARPVVNALDEPGALDPVLFRDAEVRVADPQAPENALAPVVSRLDEADSIRGFGPVVKASYVSMLHTGVVEGGLEVEVILERTARESLSNLTFGRQRLAELLDSDRFRVLVTDADLPYALWVMVGAWDGGMAGVTVHDSGGVVGVVANDRAPAVEWCRDRYDSVREGAEELSPGAFDV